jgi:hypothetical protein
MLPKAFQVRTLGWPNSKAILVGLKRRQALHSSYLDDLLRHYRPPCIVTQLPPDLPYFLKTSTEIVPSWKAFMEKGQGSFLVKPWPDVLSDVAMSQEKLTSLSQMVLNSPDYFYTGSGTVSTYCPQLEDNVIDRQIKTLQTDNFFVPIMWAINNFSAAKCVFLADLPDLVYRDQVVRHPWTIHKFRELFNSYLDQVTTHKDHFDIRFLDKAVFLDSKVAHITEVIKQACMSFPKVLVVVEYDLLEFIEAAWVDLDAQPKTLKSVIPAVEGSVPFVDTVEKHVLLDVMFEPLLNDWYIPYQFYPYTGEGSITGRERYCLEALEAWSYFFQKHKQSIVAALEYNPRAGRKFKRIRRE